MSGPNQVWLLVVMVLLQALWLATIWVTGVAPNTGKLAPLLVYSVICGVVVGLMPAGFASEIRQLKERLLRGERLLVLILCVAVFTAGVIYATFQRTYPDEVNNLHASSIVAEKGVAQFFANYTQVSWLGRQHPPLMPLTNGLVAHAFGANLLVIRLISWGLGIATLLITYLLGSKLYDRDTGFLAALFLLSCPTFFRYGTTALLAIPVTFFFSLTLLLTLKLLGVPTCRLAVATGVTIGLGFLCKYTMVLIYPTLLGYSVVTGAFRRVKLYLGVMLLVSAVIVAAWLGYAHHLGALATQMDTISSYAAVVTTTKFGKKLMPEVLLTGVPSGLGVYNLPILLLGGMHLMRRRSQSDLLVILWIASVFFPIALTLPLTRYFLPAFPALAIVMACGLKCFHERTERIAPLSLLYCGGVLYLVADWYRAAYVFL